MAVVYRHRRLDDNTVFYVGIGKTKVRAYKKDRRSTFWNNIIDKTDYSVEIIQKGISWEDACDLEQLLISEYGRRDLGTGCLVNLTDGGEGCYNTVISDETRDKMRKSATGRIHTEETKEKLRQHNTGKKHTEESKKLVSKNNARYWAGKRRPNMKVKLRRPVDMFNMEGEFIRSFMSISEAFRQAGIRNISAVCDPKDNRKKAGGFIWKYKEKVPKE